MSEENLHKNHRRRLKERFLKEGLCEFQAHNILELLLFYSIPRVDTNEIAHSLIKSCGSLSGVFDADYEKLLSCDGIGENSAILIKLIPQLARAYLLDKETRYPTFNHIDKIGKYLVNYYIGEQNEKLVACYMNNRMDMICCSAISNGIVSASEVSVRKIAELGFSKKAASFILAHNHPDGVLTPSEEDISVTGELGDIFEKLGMPLIDHIIIAGGEYRSVVSCEVKTELLI